MVDLTTLNDNQLTLLRRQSLGFIFQSFNLLPMFTARQKYTHPPDPGWGQARHNLAGCSGQDPRLGGEVDPLVQRAFGWSAAVWPSPGPSSPNLPLSLRTSPLETWIRPPRQRCSASCGIRSASWDRPSSWLRMMFLQLPLPTGLWYLRMVESWQTRTDPVDSMNALLSEEVMAPAATADSAAGR